MTSSEQNFQTSPLAIPEYVLVALPDLPRLVNALFPLTERDREELVRQCFEHILDMNRLDLRYRFVPTWSMIDLPQYQLGNSAESKQTLESLAQGIYVMIFAKLRELGMDRVVELQEGFHYRLEQIRPNGYQVLLRNLHPSYTQKRYHP